MKKEIENKSLEIIDITEEEMISINGGMYTLWTAIGYVMGVTFAISQESPNAPWVAFGSK